MSILLENDVREKTDELVDNGNDSDGFAHYFNNAEVEKVMFDGGEATALCGRKARPMNSVADKQTCPRCKEIYEGLAD